jgi:hypothetical protein
MVKGFDQKERPPGRWKPNYRPSGRGTYNCKWRKKERREAAVARQKALCESNRHIGFNKDGTDKRPLDWRMMIPASERNAE